MIARRLAPAALALLALLALLAGLAPATARAGAGCAGCPGEASALAPPLVEPASDGQTPVLILAQRAIDRAWGPPEGVTPTPPPPGMISEGRALALSAVLPGAGQLYSQQMSGVWFALAEIAGWTTHWLFTRDANRERDHAYAFAGAPGDSGSAWSFERWANAAPGRDPSSLQALYLGDRNAFYNLVVGDPSYLDGWKGAQPFATRDDFQHLRDLSDGDLDRAGWSEKALWMNHIVAAFDALRAARIHNLPIRRNLELQIKSSWRRGMPTVTAALERSF